MHSRTYTWGIALILLMSLVGGCGTATAAPTVPLPNPTPTAKAAVDTPEATSAPAIPTKTPPKATSTPEPPAQETPPSTPTATVPSPNTPTPASASGVASRRVCPFSTPVDREGPDGPYPGWGREVDERYGFILRYPPQWKLYRAGANHVTLCRGALNLTVAYRRQDENVPLPWSGLPAGDLEDLDPLSIQGHPIARQALVYEGKVKELLFSGQVDGLQLDARLHDVARLDYAGIDLSEALRDQADQIVKSLTIQAASPTQAAQTKANRLLPGWVYRSHRGSAASDLWLVDEGGWSQLVWRDPRALLSPDGRQLVVYDETSQGYRLRDRMTGAEWSLAGEQDQAPDRDECCHRWWPEQPGVLLFNSYPAGEIGLGGEPLGAISRINVDGTGYEVLDAPPILRYALVAPSPDGQTLAYSDGQTGWLYHWDGEAAAFDPSEHGLAEARDAQLYSPAWSPDGSKLAWVIKANWEGSAAPKTHVVVFDLSARSAARLLEYHQARRGYQQPAPVWSPDGRWLAFEAWSTAPDEEGMWVLPVDGEAAGRVHLGPGSDPHWSPDGRWLAFSRVEGEPNQVYVHKVGGGGAIPYLQARGVSTMDVHLVDWIVLPPGVQPAATATPLPEVARGDVVLPDRCRQALEGTSIFVNAIDGYCLRYPARFHVDDVYPPGIANLYGPALDAYPLEPVAAGSTILVEDLTGDETLSQAVHGWLERRGSGPPIQRVEGLLGGQLAEYVEYQGERTRVRAVFALHESKLYSLSFYPDDDRFPQAAEDVDALWETVTGTFAFLPPETRAALGGVEGLAHAQATRAALDEQSRALGALAQFFSLLHRGRYHEAALYYGGDYQVLRDWNPTVPPNDHATLFQKGCTVNGLQCFAIRAGVDEQRISAQEYRFTIKLARELPGEPFTYTVRKVRDRYLVQELPPHVP